MLDLINKLFIRRYAASMLLPWFVVVGPTAAQSHFSDTGSTHTVCFEVNRTFGAILIRAQVNEHPATLIVDTGSSHTIVSSALMHLSPLAMKKAPDQAKGSGFVGTARWAKATVEVGAITWANRNVLVMTDFQDLSSSMKEEIDGILGEDALKEFSVITIDYKHHRLILSR